MKNLQSIMRTGFALFIVALVASSSFAQRNLCIVEAKADTADMLIGEQTTLTVTAKVAAGAKLTFPTYGAEEEMVPGLEVVRNGKTDTLVIDDGSGWQLSRTYVVTSFDSAIYAIVPEVFLEGDTIKSRTTVGLKVSTVPVDTTKVENFIGPYGSVDEEFELDWIFLASIVLLFCTIAFIVVIVRRYRRNKPLPPQIVVEQTTSPHTEALDAIAKIRDLPRNTREENETYYTRLSEILRRYLKRRFEVDAMNLTTTEIVGILIQKQNVAQLSELGEILNTSDLVKFAKYSASLNESDKNLLQAADYIHQTHSQMPPQQPRVVSIEPQGNAEKRMKRTRLRRYMVVLLIVLAVLLIYVSKVISEIFI